MHADELGDTFTDDMIERINDRLDHPDRYRTAGRSTPSSSSRRTRAPLAAELAPGDGAEIVRLAEHDGDLLHWFYDEGLVAGTQVTVRGAQKAAGQLTILARRRRAADHREGGGRDLCPRGGVVFLRKPQSALAPLLKARVGRCGRQRGNRKENGTHERGVTQVGRARGWSRTRRRGGGSALAAHGTGDRAAPREARLAKVAEQRGDRWT